MHQCGGQCVSDDAHRGGKISGNALVSDNPDLGFVVANDSGTPLTPNNLNSKIPFRLDDSAQAQVGIGSGR